MVTGLPSSSARKRSRFPGIRSIILLSVSWIFSAAEKMLANGDGAVLVEAVEKRQQRCVYRLGRLPLWPVSNSGKLDEATVLANAAYCAAHVVDIVLQLSVYRTAWLRVRWILLAIGVAFGAVLANFLSRGLFANGA
jgi:hypothetical protein